MLKWVHGIQGGRTNRDTLPCYTVFTSVFLWYVPEVNHWKYFLRLSGEMYGLAITVDTTIPWYRSCRPTPIRPYLDKEFQAQSLPWSHLTFNSAFSLHDLPLLLKMAAAQLIDGLSGFASGKGHIQKTVITGQKALWGRRANVSGFSSLPSMLLMIGAPLLVLLISVALTHYDGSIARVLDDLYSHGALPFLMRYCPSLTTQGIIAYISWLVFQALLYQVLPGRIVSGPPTPGGYSLPYKVNGLWSWFASLAVFIGLVKAGRLDPTFVAVHQGELIIIANIYGFLITAASVAKSHLLTQNTRDIRFSGM